MIGRFLLGTAIGGLLGVAGLVASQVLIPQVIEAPQPLIESTPPQVKPQIEPAAPLVEQTAAAQPAVVMPQVAPQTPAAVAPEVLPAPAAPEPQPQPEPEPKPALPEHSVPEAIQPDEADLPPLTEEELALLAAMAAGEMPDVTVEASVEMTPDPILAKPPAAAPAEVQPAELSPLQAFAQPFAITSNKPLFSVVLIDAGEADLDRQALADLPLSISFALDPRHENVAEQAALYRAAGREVIMLLPEGTDAATLAEYGNKIPQAVVVMEQSAQSFQSDRAISEAIVPEIIAQGRGLLTWEGPNNLAEQLAKRQALPSAVIFRSLDEGNEEAPVIRRYLDRAVVKADQEGQVTVIGQARAETIKALIEWSIEGRSANVTLAPLSASLTTRIIAKP